METPEIETSQLEMPESNVFEPEIPEAKMPEAEASVSEMSGAEVTGAETPETEVLEMETPDEDTPEIETTEVEDLQAETSDTEILDKETRAPRNSKYAGEIYPLEDKNPELADKYSDSVRFDEEGYPDFSPYAIKTVEIDMTGDRYSDFQKANEAAELEETPEGFTWHHNQDCKTMQLVPSDLHNQIQHTGGVSILKNKE